jgi:hypothetical protein
LKNYTKDEIRERGKEVVHNCKHRLKKCAKKSAKNLESCLYTTVGTVAILYDKMRYKKTNSNFIELQ